MHAYALRSEGDEGVSPATLPEAIDLWSRGCIAMWVDLEEPTKEEMQSLGEAFRLDEESLVDCLEGEQRPRIDEFDDCIFLVLYGAVGVEDYPEFNPRKLAIFLGKNFLITVHREPLKTIQNLDDRLNKRGQFYMARGIDFLFYSLLDTMVDNFTVAAGAFDERLDVLEDRSLQEDIEPDILSDVSDLRRDLLELRRIAHSQRDLLQPIVAGEYEYVSEDLAVRFSHVRDHLTTTIETVDNLRELLHGVLDGYRASLSDRMNSIMKTLTIFASLFLPLSLIAGIYGMNTPLWPAGSNPYSFWLVIGAMGLVMLIMLGFFKYKRWF